MFDVPAEVAARIRRPAPAGHAVVEGSLPVVSFGDYRTAEVATLALNPSSLEFLNKQGGYLLADLRRLASWVSMQRREGDDLSDAEVAQVFDDSNTYFGRRPYKPWFQWLQTLLTSTGLGSYCDGTACHLDLVQWATKPAQGKLSAEVWRRLVDEDRKFLAWQLAQTPAKVILVNGAACVEWLGMEGLVTWQAPERLVFPNTNGTSGHLQVYLADQEGKRFIGWNRPLAGPIPAAGRLALQEWVSAHSQCCGLP
jgi:hypothetical protein